VGLRLRRGGARAKRDPEGPPPLLEGQVVTPSGSKGPSVDSGETATKGAPAAATPPATTPPPSTVLDPVALSLPTDGPAMIRYLTHRYKGVGQKTAETLVKEFGPGLYQVMHADPDRIRAVIPANRAEQVLTGWQADYARREERIGNDSGSQPKGRGSAPGSAPNPPLHTPLHRGRAPKSPPRRRRP
jgi:hypothetical protein